MDLDHLGLFNKNHGTPTGDAVLRKFVRVAEDSLRATDWLARYPMRGQALGARSRPGAPSIVRQRPEVRIRPGADGRDARMSVGVYRDRSFHIGHGN
jgi:hypothetical protein